MTNPETAILQHHVDLARTVFSPSWKANRISSAPGRIELIGNHLDYNGGPVLAAAIDRRIWISAGENQLHYLRAVFSDFGDDPPVSITVEEHWGWTSSGGAPTPVDYLRGTVAALSGRGHHVQGSLDLVVSGDLPHGVGISSSAALCVALTQAISQESLEPSELVLTAQEAENRAGSPCGTMDQSASVFGEVIRFDGATNNVNSISAELGSFEFLIANSGVVRSLASSSYPTRVVESHSAVKLLKNLFGPSLQSLAHITEDRLEAVESTLGQSGNVSLFPRVRHVVTETARVNEAAGALRAADWTGFGALMTASGRSSALDYEISHPDVEELVRHCLDTPGVVGARMMGGGEGGSALVLLDSRARSHLISALRERYYTPRSIDGLENMVIPCRFDRGASVRSAP